MPVTSIEKTMDMPLENKVVSRGLCSSFLFFYFILLLKKQKRSDNKEYDSHYFNEDKDKKDILQRKEKISGARNY